MKTAIRACARRFSGTSSASSRFARTLRYSLKRRAHAMTSFRAIAGQQSTSLAVVAPGIAEALFATAIGLIAAIPATIFYNKFVSDVNKQAQRLEGFADEFAAILSRQIDERG